MVQLMRYPLPILNIGMEIKMRFVYYTKYKCYKDLKQNKKKQQQQQQQFDTLDGTLLLNFLLEHPFLFSIPFDKYITRPD